MSGTSELEIRLGLRFTGRQALNDFQQDVVRVNGLLDSIYQTSGKTAADSARVFQEQFAAAERYASEFATDTTRIFAQIDQAASKSAEASAAAFERHFAEQEQKAARLAESRISMEHRLLEAEKQRIALTTHDPRQRQIAVAEVSHKQNLLRLERELHVATERREAETIAGIRKLIAAERELYGLRRQSLARPAGTPANAAGAGGGKDLVAGWKAEAVGMAAAFFSIQALVNGVTSAFVAGVRNADSMRDLAASLEAVEGSATSAQRTLEFFNRQQEETRRTGDAMAAVYADLLPTALERGFSPEHFRQVVVELDQLATRIRKTPDEVNAAFAQILGGNPGKKNVILRALGLDPEAVREGRISATELLTKISELAREGREMGDDFKSASDKAKASLLDAFGTGWNEARKETDSAVDHIIGRLEDPRLLAGLKRIAGVMNRAGVWTLDFLTDPGQSGWLGSLNPASGLNNARALLAMFGGGEERNAAGGGATGSVPPAWMFGKYGQNDITRAAAVAPHWLFQQHAATPAAGTASSPDFTSDEHKERVQSLRDELELLKATNPYHKAEAAYRRDMAAAAREQNSEVRSLMEQIAKYERSNTLSDLARQERQQFLAIQAERRTLLATNPVMRSHLESIRDMAAMPGQMDAATDAAARLGLRLTDITAILSQGASFWRAELDYQHAVAAAMDLTSDAARREALAAAEANKILADSLAFSQALSAGRTLSSVMPRTTWREERAKLERAAESDARLRDMEEGFGLLNWEADQEVVRLERAAQRWQLAFREGTDLLHDAALDFARTGGENFADIVAQRLTQLTARGMTRLVQDVFGGGTPKQDEATGLWYLGGVAYENEADALNARSKKVQRAGAVMDIAAIGVGAYGAAHAADGARSAGVMNGALGGLSAAGALGIASGWGALLGAVVGGIAGYFGEKQRQSEYKYGVPTIGPGGVSVLQSRNINPEERRAMETQVRERYESIWNVYVKALLTVPDSVIPEQGMIVGRFQDRASKFFMKHFNEWVNGTLPDEIANQFKGELKNVSRRVGINDARFEQLYRNFDQLDPAKAAALWGELLSSMVSLRESMKFFGDGAAGPASAWQTGLAEERRLMNRSFADVMTEDYFSKILEMSRGLDALIGADQIHNLQEIARLQAEAADAQKAAMREIVRLSGAAKEKADNAVDSLMLMGFRKADGSPDYAGQAEFLNARAEAAYRKINTATTAADADRAYTEYIALVNQIVSLGYQINADTGEKWRLWAIDQIRRAEVVVQQRYDTLGTDISIANAKFLEQFRPYLDSFTTVITSTNDGLGGLDIRARDAGASLIRFKEDLDDAAARLRAFGVGGDGYNNGSSFESTTAGRRVA